MRTQMNFDRLGEGRGIELASGKLWSLLDMYKLHGRHFFEAVVWLARLKNNSELEGFENQGEMIDTFLDNLEKELVTLQLPLSLKFLRRFRITKTTYKGSPLWGKIYQARVDELNSRIEDEIDICAIYCLSPTESAFARQEGDVFGLDVSQKFPETRFDFEEARQCMALGRWTGAVFHLMRAMEAAVAILADKLSATIQDSSGRTLAWGVLLSNMDDKIREMDKGDTKNAMSKARALLFHVNSAYRTETMHPKQTYTEEEATSSYEATGSFMKHLATLV